MLTQAEHDFSTGSASSLHSTLFWSEVPIESDYEVGRISRETYERALRLTKKADYIYSKRRGRPYFINDNNCKCSRVIKLG